MDFYSRQAAARGQTRWLVFAFTVSLLAIALALDFVLFTFIAARNGQGLSALDYAQSNPGQAMFCTLAVMGVLGLASLYKSMELRGGGGVVARSLGGVRVSSDTTDLKLRRLHNVIEEMAIASGVPMPEVYVLEQESAINAFAAGHTPANAAVTVTQGALDRLSRDELQGVIAHEFSHVLNGDMRLNVQLMGWVFGLFVIALIGRMILQFSPRNRRNSNGLVAVGFAVMVLGYVGLLAGRILQAAVSRQRERLADASGVQFTRNPQGLRGALVKIAALPEGSQLVAADAEQAAHMFFADALSRVFATHPPILERIRELDPHFDPRELERVAAEPDQDPSPEEFVGHGTAVGRGVEGSQAGVGRSFGSGHVPAIDQIPGVGQMPGMGQIPGVGVGVGQSSAASRAAEARPLFVVAAANATASPNVATSASSAEEVVTQVGRPETAHILHARAVRLALPDSLREIVESPGKAQALVLALLVSSDPAIRERQLERLGKSVGPANLAVVERMLPIAQSLPPMLRLPALQQMFPALRRATAAQRKGLAQLASDLIHADARIDVFEFCLAKLLETLLNDELNARAPHGTLSLEDAENEIFLLFATLAQVGAQDERTARMAYEAGMSVVLPMHRPPFAVVEDWAKKLSDALPRLEQLHPFAKKAVIEGLVKTISNDEVLTEEEAELLRTTCALLHCPLPPLLPTVEGDTMPPDTDAA
ncbi:MAG: Peptidase Ste24p [Gammaproteobacteria bacterium]|nr:Peptidase Ste24p [Gammaproteobacteria bacterium]